MPFLIWVRDTVCPDILAAGRAAGLGDAGGPPLLVLDPISGIPAPPSELEIELVTTPDGVVDHASTLRDGFGLPAEVVDRLIDPALLDQPDAGVFVGRVDGRPVSCSLLVTSGPTAGVYNVATLGALRGKGYGAALTWAAVAEGARRGCTHAVLQSSESGYPVYRRMGFTDLGRYAQLQGPPRASAA